MVKCVITHFPEHKTDGLSNAICTRSFTARRILAIDPFGSCLINSCQSDRPVSFFSPDEHDTQMSALITGRVKSTDECTAFF